MCANSRTHITWFSSCHPTVNAASAGGFRKAVRSRADHLRHFERALVTSALPVRRGKAALSSGCKSHPATAPAGSNRSSYGGNEMAEAFG